MRNINCELVRDLIFIAIGFFAGMAGPISGVTTLVSFPALLASGISPIEANVINTLGVVVPASVSSSMAYRTLISLSKRTFLVLAAVSVIGGVLGAVALKLTTERVFVQIVPLLLLFGAAVIILQPFIFRRLNSDNVKRVQRLRWTAVGTLATCIYSGYFGAGAGMLLVLLFVVTQSLALQNANALKCVISVTSNVGAALSFLLLMNFSFRAVCMLAVGSIAGGQLGAKLAQRLPDMILRIALALGGVGAAIYVLYR